MVIYTTILIFNQNESVIAAAKHAWDENKNVFEYYSYYDQKDFNEL